MKEEIYCLAIVRLEKSVTSNDGGASRILQEVS